MATNELVEQPARAIGDWTRRLAPAQSFCITTMRSVNADRQGVFHALTIPKYIETWLSAPGALAGRTVVCRRDNFFPLAIPARRADGPGFFVHTRYAGEANCCLRGDTTSLLREVRVW
jgi:hypothetical protein